MTILKKAVLKVCQAQKKSMAIELRMDVRDCGLVLISEMTARKARRFAEAILDMIDERESK